jgi:hypothetical protein
VSEEWQAQIYELMEKADGASGAEKIALLDEALRLTDLRYDVERSSYIREELFQALYWDGQFVRALAEFNIMLAAADRHADSWGGEINDRLLWLYKWVADNPQKYLSVSRPQMEAMFADVQRRYEAAGLSMRAIHSLRCTFSVDIGETEQAKRYYQFWQAADEDGSEDCAACELSTEVYFLIDVGQVDAALEKAKPLFAGKLRCEEVPNTTFSLLLPTLVRRGQLERAKKAQAMSIKQMRESRKFLGYLG